MQVSDATPTEVTGARPMSAQGQIMAFIGSLTPNEKGIIPLTSKAMSLQVGINAQVVSKTLNTMSQTGRIELVKGKNGRDIVGIKPIDLEPRQRGGAAHVGAATKPRAEKHRRRVRYSEPVQIMPAAARRAKSSVSTPATDHYAKAKADFARIQSNEFIEATFKTNDYAEESLALRDRLATTESQLIEERMTKEALEREFKALQARKQAALADAAAAAQNGVVAATN